MKAACRNSLVFCLCMVVLWTIWTYSADDGWDRIKARDVLRVGYSVEAPYAYLDAQGHVVGQSPAIIERVVRELGISRIEWVLVPFTELIPSLLERRYDMIGISIFVTELRQTQVVFAEPCVSVRSGLLVRKDTVAPAPQNVDRLLVEGHGRIAVLNGSEEHRFLTDSPLANRLTIVPDVYAGRTAILQREAIALALSMPTVNWQARSHAELTALPLPSGVTQAQHEVSGAFAFHPDDQVLKEHWNRAQAKVLAQDDFLGVLQSFGFSEAEQADSDVAGESAR